MLNAVDPRYGEGIASAGHESHTGADKSSSPGTKKSSVATAADVA